ncbi:MAG TPA: DUF1295 domain-containing protein [Pirellulales bacterium]|nr:DUF1295 domain-containing protein [Pirellulales bacterium]
MWKVSRHPNYFFECLHWWSYVCFAANSSWAWATLIGPVAMWIAIRFVSGIPPNEAQAVRSRGAAYRDYQRTTSALIPWFPRRPAR